MIEKISSLKHKLLCHPTDFGGFDHSCLLLALGEHCGLNLISNEGVLGSKVANFLLDLLSFSLGQ